MKTHYEKWHERKYHKHVHFSIFAVYAAMVAGTVLGVASNPQILKAGSDSFIYTSTITTNPDVGPVTFNSGKVTLQTDKDSAIANGNDAITISAGSFSYDDPNVDDPTVTIANPVPACFDGGNQAVQLKITATGSGNTIDPTSQAINCSTGLATFTLKSTTPESKTISYYFKGKGGFDIDPVTGDFIPAENWIKDENLSLTVNFNPAPTANNTSTTISNTNTTKTVVPKNTIVDDTAQTPTTESKPVDIPVTDEKPLVITKVNETSFSDETDENIFEETKKFKLAGKTFPNAKVTLYVYSEPFVATTQADAEGYWEYEVTKELEPGGHRVEAEVTKEDGSVIPKKEIATFRVAAASTKTQTIGNTLAKKKINPAFYYLTGALALLFGTITVTVITKKRKLKKSN